MLADVVTPACSARGPGRKRSACVSGRESSSRPATAANESWKLTSKRLFGIDGQQPGSRDEEHEPAVGRARREHREQPGDPGDAGAHDRRRGPGEQHVGGDDRQQRQRACQPRNPEEHEREAPHRAQQNDVLARHSHDVEQTAAPEVVDDLLGHALVVAEHHALQHVGDRRAKTRREVCPRGEAKPVDLALHPSATADQAKVVEIRGEHHVLAAAPQVAAVVETAVGRRRGQVLHPDPVDGRGAPLPSAGRQWLMASSA